MFIRNNCSKLTTFAYGVSCAKKREMVYLFIYLFIYHFPKEYVGWSIQNAVNTKLYINSKILRAVYLDSFSDFLTLILFSTRSTSWSEFYANFFSQDFTTWIIISCYSNGYIGALPGVFSVWFFPRHILVLS